MTQEPLARYNPGIQNFILDFDPAYPTEGVPYPLGVGGCAHESMCVYTFVCINTHTNYTLKCISEPHSQSNCILDEKRESCSAMSNT